MQSDNSEFNASGDIGTLPRHTGNRHCFANLASRRHIILKERLTASGPRPPLAHGLQQFQSRETLRKFVWRVAYLEVIRREPWTPPHDANFMTFLSAAQHRARGSYRGHMLPIMLAAAASAAAVALVAYLLWPTWEPDTSSNPARLPVSIGATLFNVPTAAIRMKNQRRSGAQERIDL